MSAFGYRRFLYAEWRFLLFGFATALSSSFGQTFFIALFGPGIQSDLELSHTAWGSIYLIGTLSSAVLLPFTGRLIDRFRLGPYTLTVMALLIVACLAISRVHSAWWLVIAIFALRHGGQGLMSHVAITSMARYYDQFRGRAIAVASTGFATGEALLPFFTVSLIAAYGWRQTYVGAAAVLVIVFLPLVMALLRHRPRPGQAARRMVVGSAGESHYPRSWTRAEVVRDPRFRFMLPGLMAPSMIVTAMFFHHLNIADEKGWSHEWITANYVIYAAVATGMTLVAGPLIDRLSAARVVRWMPVPLVISMLVLTVSAQPFIVWVYFAFVGLAVGLHFTASSALWAELYGIDYLGSIKSMAAALSVFASALGPVIAGAMIDLGFSFNAVFLVFAAYATVTGGLIWHGLGMQHRQ